MRGRRFVGHAIACRGFGGETKTARNSVPYGLTENQMQDVSRQLGEILNEEL